MNTQEITFGIELEVYLPNKFADKFPVGGYHNGIPIADFPPTWNAQRDGSIGGKCPVGHFPVEIVSPVLKGDSGLMDVATVVEVLKLLKAKSSDACGIHVHVGRPGTETQLKSAVNAFKTYESAFWALNGSGYAQRVQSVYCKPRAMWNDTRYQSVNFTNRNTIEVRCFECRIETEFVLTAIYMVVAVMARAMSQSLKVGAIIDPVAGANKFALAHLRTDKFSITNDVPSDVEAYLMAQAALTTPTTATI